MKKQHEDILLLAENWKKSGKEVSLATVISTWGSSPRPIGSQLIANKDGDFEGSVSGGCIEGAVIEAAIKSINTGIPDTLNFEVSDEEAWEVGLACGGTVQVYVEKVD